MGRRYPRLCFVLRSACGEPCPRAPGATGSRPPFGGLSHVIECWIGVTWACCFPMAGAWVVDSQWVVRGIVVFQRQVRGVVVSQWQVRGFVVSQWQVRGLLFPNGRCGVCRFPMAGAWVVVFQRQVRVIVVFDVFTGYARAWHALRDVWWCSRGIRATACGRRLDEISVEHQQGAALGTDQLNPYPTRGASYPQRRIPDKERNRIARSSNHQRKTVPSLFPTQSRWQRRNARRSKQV